MHPVHAQLSFLSQKPLSKSCIDHIQSSVIAFNLSLTSSKGIALTCISVFSFLSEAQSPDLCVCPAFSTLNLSLAFHWPFLKSWTLTLLTFYLEFLSTSSIWKGPYMLLVKTWPTFSPVLTPLLRTEATRVCVCVKEFWGRLRSRMRKCVNKDKRRRTSVFFLQQTKKWAFIFLFSLCSL